MFTQNTTASQQKKVAIVQSCYIPWKGYFEMIARVDEFILYDDVQYVKRHWHNRNKIKTPQGAQWLTIPVNTKGHYLQNIDQTEISGQWADTHWRSLKHNYHKAPFFTLYEKQLETLYQKAAKLKFLSEVNHLFLSEICAILEIKTIISQSSSYPAKGIKTDRLLSICKQVGATYYLSGPSAKSYFETEKFEQAAIETAWMDYSNYREYPQLYGAFDHAVTILDILLNCGPKTMTYIKTA